MSEDINIKSEDISVKLKQLCKEEMEKGNTSLKIQDYKNDDLEKIKEWCDINMIKYVWFRRDFSTIILDWSSDINK